MSESGFIMGHRYRRPQAPYSGKLYEVVGIDRGTGKRGSVTLWEANDYGGVPKPYAQTSAFDDAFDYERWVDVTHQTSPMLLGSRWRVREGRQKGFIMRVTSLAADGRIYITGGPSGAHQRAPTWDQLRSMCDRLGPEERSWVQSNSDAPPVPAEDDPVQSPSHYGSGVYQVVNVIEAWGLKDCGYLWAVIKYVARHLKKGKPLEDLKKARWYLDREIAIMGGESWNPQESEG